MTAITFPTDPANGELYTAPNGAVYIWDGEKWMVNSTTYTGTALTEITQDRVHSMFTHGENVGISFSYNDSTDKLIATGLSISDFGEGFTDSLDSGKITTSKLYNENPNPGLSNQYTLEVTNGGVVVLPDGSIINGATLKTIAGNYAGITAGPASPAGKDEDSWVWVDNNGATIATKYSTDAHTWTFNNNGDLTLPAGGDIKDSTGNSVLGGGAGDSITNGGHSVSIASNGVVTMSTSRGTLEFGALPEPGGTYHFHVMKGAGQDGSGGMDLYFGDDYNYVLQRADSYQGSEAYGVEIGANDRDGGDQHVWRFDPDGDLHIPPGKTIRDAMTGDDLLAGAGGGTAALSNVWVQEFATSLGLTDVPLLASSVEYLGNGDVVALFLHSVNSESSYYSGVARFDTHGTRVWSMKFENAEGDIYINGWGLAVDNVGGYIYVAGQKSAETGYAVATLTKLSQTDGDIVWSKQYDVGYANTNFVVDVASDGNPVVVGYADNGTDKQVVTTKINADTGSVTWSRALNGQGDEEAYGMAVGSNGEMVSVGWMDQHNEQLTRSVTPLYGSDTGILVINRSDLNGATFTDSWEVAGTGITGTANINSINTYDALTGTVQQGSGAVFTVEVNGAVINTESVIGDVVVALASLGYNNYGYSNSNDPDLPFGSTTATSLAELYHVANHPLPHTRLKLIPGIYAGFTVSANGLIDNNTDARNFIVGGTGAQMTPEEVSAGVYVYFDRSGVDVYNLVSQNTQTLAVKVGYSDIPDTAGSYSVLVTNGGSNYLTGHKIKVLGTALGGTTPENDVVITVDAVVSGVITSVSRTGDANVAAVGPYTTVAYTNHNVGSGLTFTLNLDSGSTYTEHPYSITDAGTNYVDGDVVVIPGTQLGGASPTNDLTTVVSVTGGGVSTFNSFTGAQQTTTYRIIVTGSTVNFSGPGTWTLGNLTNDTVDRMLIVKYLSDGTIDWQKAVQVEAGFDCKGADADIDGGGNIYVCGNFEYNNSVASMIIFKLDTAGVKQWTRKVEGTCEDFATSIVFGSDGYLYLSAVTNTGSDYSMVIAKYDTNGNVIWQRLLDNTTSWTFAGGLFFGMNGGSNLAVKDGYVAVSGSFGDPGTGPQAIVTQFDADGTTFAVGNYDFMAASFSGVLDNTASEITMTGAAKTDSDYIEEFTITNFSPTVDLTSDLIGTIYSSPLGTTGTVKLTAPGNRKIEEVYGYNSVSVTERIFGSVVTTTAAVANTGYATAVTVSVTAPQLEELVALINGNTFYYFEVSLDNNTYRKATYGGYNNAFESENFTFVLDGGVTLAVSSGTTVYYRIVTGADPVVWWNSANLPNGNNNFRGAVIDYHAYTGESTIIGTIHIVNDDGEEHITHTEVQSGTSDGENDYLWLVQNEGTVSYYRIDGEDKTLKVQWTAKVFYGSEYYDD
jgi:hypothetical protein